MDKNELKNVSVSHATMRAEDLVPAFVSAVRAIEGESIESQLESKLAYIENESEKDGYYESEDSQYDLDWLFDTLDALAPDGCYFGSHLGDGSDYGFWECENEEEEEEQNEQDTNPAYCPICDSGDSTVLGTLGKRVYYRCTACGMDFSHSSD